MPGYRCVRTRGLKRVATAAVPGLLWTAELTLLALAVILIVKLTIPSSDARTMAHRAGANPAALASGLSPGVVLPLTGIDWGKGDRHVVIALHTKCVFSNEDAEFYRVIAEHAMADERLQVSVLGQENEAVLRGWLAQRRIEVSDVISHPNPIAVGVRSTPTLMLLNSGGVLTDIVSGPSSPHREAVLQRLSGDGRAEPIHDHFSRGVATIGFDLGELVKSATGGYVLLDVGAREEYARDRHPEARSIPLDELELRAGIELVRSESVILDCSRVSSAKCVRANEILQARGFAVLALVNPPELVEGHEP